MVNKARTKTLLDDLSPVKATLMDIQLMLNVSSKEVARLVTEGILKKDTRGTYDFLFSMKGYIAYLQARSGMRGTRTGAPTDYAEERARLTKAQADKGEMEAALMAGQLVHVEQLTTEWETMLMSMKAKLVAIPSKVATLVADEDNPAIIQSIIDDYMREALQELANYGDGTGVSKTDPAAGDESPDTAPETDSKPVGRRRKAT
jgi:phage terminase Nu1 subunit (DNA packaging protein)